MRRLWLCGGAPLALALASACAGDGLLSRDNPHPAIDSISPVVLLAGSPGSTLTVHGSGFVRRSHAEVGGSGRPTTFVSGRELRVALTAEDLDRPGELLLSVSTPPPGGGQMLPVRVFVGVPAATITALSPAFLPTGGSGDSVTITGTGFYRDSNVRVGDEVRPATFISNTQLRAGVNELQLSESGMLPVRVENGGEGFDSNTATLEVRAPVPAITSLREGTAVGGEPGFALWVTGTRFTYNSVVRLNGIAQPTRTHSTTSLEATLDADDLRTPGTYSITVFTPAPGGGLSNAVPFVIVNPVPAITRIVPFEVPAGGTSATITVQGTGFVPQSQALVGGAPRQTTYTSDTELSAVLTAADLAVATDLVIRVRNPPPGGGTSAPDWIGVHAPVPVLMSLDPAHVMDGLSRFVLRVNGTGFMANSEVQIDASPLPTRMVSPTRLEATLGAGELVHGIYPIYVSTPGPGGGDSNVLSLEVRAPVPVITSLGATQVEAGEPGYDLTVRGTGFTVNSTVRLDGRERFVNYADATHLEVSLDLDDLQEPRTFAVTVATPGPGGGTSNAVQFRVVAPAQP